MSSKTTQTAIALAAGTAFLLASALVASAHPADTEELADGFQDGEWKDDWNVKKRQSDAWAKVVDSPPKAGDKALQLHTGDTYSGDMNIRRPIEGPVSPGSAFSMWVRVDDDNNNIKLYLEDSEGEVTTLGFGAFDEIEYSTDAGHDARIITGDEVDAHRWYHLSVVLHPKRDEVTFVVETADGDRWEVEGVPAEVDYQYVGIGDSDYYGNHNAFVDGITYGHIHDARNPTTLTAHPLATAPDTSEREAADANLSARLVDSSTGEGLAGQLVLFEAHGNGDPLCYGRTNESGVATCRNPSSVARHLDESGYRAVFRGSENHKPSSDAAPWVESESPRRDRPDRDAWSFDGGPSAWETGLHPCNDGSDDRESFGSAGWSSRYQGSLRLHAEGAPGAADAWIPIKRFRNTALAEGAVVRASYDPSDFVGAPGHTDLLLRPPAPCSPGSQVVELDRDEGRPGGPTVVPDGLLQGTVPRDIPTDWHLSIQTQAWPADHTILLRRVSVTSS